LGARAPRRGHRTDRRRARAPARRTARRTERSIVEGPPLSATVFDADGHVLEPGAAWDALPDDIRPRIATDERGLDHVWVGTDEVFVAKLGQMGTPGSNVSTGSTAGVPLEKPRAGR